MAVMLWLMGLCLLMQAGLCSAGQPERGCLKWTNGKGKDICCEICHPGNRLVKRCGPSSADLCTPCESGTYTTNLAASRCDRCSQCAGAQVLMETCTPTTNTKCGCKEGLTCGDDQCKFCVETCAKGQEPTTDRSCRPCPNGTFNDKIHQKCKPWSSKCPNPGQKIVANGDAVSDIQCDVSQMNVKKPDDTEQPLTMMIIIFVLMAFGIIIIVFISVAFNILQKKQKTQKPSPKTPIIRTPTDDPRTLIAIECSFHEAEQEQGNSSESLYSKDSSEQLIA
ncbi:tumor necrosis factor receptor superfamily member 9a [Brachyistius frenatus]|uniref:tumor necrosis factor receptor superfamily member 9a n=1 Tax=Brachyistius frenatus TaxID=100188 RepID=UPI0037E7255B